MAAEADTRTDEILRNIAALSAEFVGFRREVNQRLDKIDESIHVIAMTFKSMDERFGRMEKRLEHLEK